jgi:hypothetical protein
VRNVAGPCYAGKRQSLRLGDRNQRCIAEPAVERLQVREIEPAMQSRNSTASKVAKVRKVHQIGVKMQDVEFGSPLAHFFKLHDLVRQ